MLGLEAEHHPEWVRIKQHQRGAEASCGRQAPSGPLGPCEESSIRERGEADSAPESWASGRTSRAGA